MDRVFFLCGCALAFLAVALGAFGAHGLRGKISPEMLAIFEVGVRYALAHALALLAVGLAATRWPSPLLTTAGFLFVAGVVIFSGSLWILALTETRWWGAVTPIGGLAFLGGWAALFVAVLFPAIRR